MMRIYLMQHGDAVPKEQDPDRPLTPEGSREIASLAETLAGYGVRIARVLHSGKSRARQTAEIMAQWLTGHGEVETRPQLGPTDPLGALMTELTDWREETLVVGHMPYVSRLLSALVVGDEQRPVVDYRPGGVAALDRQDDGTWLITWMLRPGLR